MSNLSPAHPHLVRLAQFYESLGSPVDLVRIAELYAPDAHFRDPFNSVQGPAAIRTIFEHMFRALREPRFSISSRLAQGEQAFLVWDLHFGFPSDAPERRRRIHGATHLRFNAEGQVAWHRDYWDAAEELYEQLPLVGGAMRWLKRRVNAGG